MESVMEEEEEISIKCVLVGDSTVGKTSILWRYTMGTDYTEYIPTINSNFSTTLTLDDRTINLELWDTAGVDEYERFRPMSYYETHVCLICFSVVNPTSFENILTKWHPEISHHCPNIPVLLVGTKTDLRDNDSSVRGKSKDVEILAPSQGRSMAKEIGAVKYMECSSHSRTGIQELFHEATRAALQPFVPPLPAWSCGVV